MVILGFYALWASFCPLGAFRWECSSTQFFSASFRQLHQAQFLLRNRHSPIECPKTKWLLFYFFVSFFAASSCSKLHIKVFFFCVCFFFFLMLAPTIGIAHKSKWQNSDLEILLYWGIQKAPPANPRTYIYRYYNIDPKEGL